MEQNIVYLINNPSMITEAEYDQLYRYLPAYRQAKVQALRFHKDQILSVLAGALFIYALKECYGFTEQPEIIQEGNEKPVIKDHPEICFNLSHCKTAIACAVSEKQVGVDVQENRASIEKIAKRFFSENEIKMISSIDDKFLRENLYRRVWTLKEAYGKYTGKGLMYKLQDKDFSEILVKDVMKEPYHCIYEKKRVLMLDEDEWSMAAISDLPLIIRERRITDLCEKTDESWQSML